MIPDPGQVYETGDLVACGFYGATLKLNENASFTHAEINANWNLCVSEGYSTIVFIPFYSRVNIFP